MQSLGYLTVSVWYTELDPEGPTRKQRKNLSYQEIQSFDRLIDDRSYSAILRSLEQTHRDGMWFYMSD